MNSGAKPRTGALAFGLLAAAAFAVLSAGCSDHGPTGLYSGSLFGVNGAGANMEFQIYQSYENSVTVSAGTGGDQYVMFMKNTGQGTANGPIIATATLSPGCGETLSSTATAVFGNPGQVINPGQVLQGYSCNASGAVLNSAYSWATSFPVACSATAAALVFNVAARDAKGQAWNLNFTGTDY
jgi:hypothetical protein